MSGLGPVSPEAEAHGKKVAADFAEHLDRLYDSLPEDLAHAYYGGFLRACDEVEVNLHYFIDGRLPRPETEADQ